MITRPTVLILGAGASYPYGFPLGSQLRKELCQLETGYESTFGQHLIHHGIVQQRDLISFARAFQKSNVASIDAFLARRPEFEELGKKAIAAALCAKESFQAFYPKAGSSSGESSDDWYAHLWNMLLGKAATPEELKGNKVKIVSFNYDRSLEAFLFTSIQNTFGLNNEAALNTLNYFPILHVYGQLGKFHPTEVFNDLKTYSPEISSISLSIASAGIKIIPEARHDAEEFETARKWVAEAEVVCFLGFGFDELNIERLNFKHTFSTKLHQLSQGKTYTIIVSGFGKTQAELRLARGALGADLLSWFAPDMKTLETIRNSADAFRY